MTSPPSTPGSGPFSPGAGSQATLPPRLATGVAGLDTILQGGFFRRGIYLIAGAPGTGKTILGNQIAVHHAATGGRVVYISLLSESFTRMFGHLSSLTFFQEPGIQPLIGDALYYISGYGVLQTDGLKGLLALLHGALRDRHATLLILDSVLNIEAFATSGLAFKEFIHSLQQYTEIYGSTGLLLSSQEGRAGEGDRAALQTTVDGLIHLTRRRVGVRVVRELEVVKFRGSDYLPGAHVLDISGAGVTMYPRTEALLAAPAGMDSLVAASRERVAFGIVELDEMLDGGVVRGSTTALFGRCASWGTPTP